MKTKLAMRFLRRRYGEYIPRIDGGAGVALKKIFSFSFRFSYSRFFRDVLQLDDKLGYGFITSL
jgi:hypothetical protein